MPTEYNILTQDTPVGGVAAAFVNVFDAGVADDMASVRVVLKSNIGATLSDETYSGSDVSTTATDGGAITITNPAGVGTYKWTYTVPTGVYTIPASGLTFTITVTVTDDAGEGGGSQSEVFSFKIVPSSLDITLDNTAIVNVLKRQARLTREKGVVLNAGISVISLDNEIIYGLDQVLKNGVTATGGGTDYTWVTGRPNLSLAAASSANDFWQITYHVKLSNTAIEDYITDATRWVNSRLKPFYSDTALTTYPTVANLIKDIALGRIKEELSEGVALESAFYRSGMDLKNAAMLHTDRICRGEADIVDNAGAIVARRNNVLVSGFRHSDGAIESTQDIRERLAAFDSFALSFYPLTPDNITTSA